MTYAEASEIVRDYTGDNLLESLEELDDMDGELFDLLPHEVKVAYRTLMAGFREMFAPKI